MTAGRQGDAALLTSAPGLSPGGAAVMLKLHRAAGAGAPRVPRDSTLAAARLERQAAVPMILE